MNTQEIINGNKLIAEFMGLTQDKPSKTMFFDMKDCPNAESFEVKYHSSWDWLMPVVKKIETIGFDVSMKGISCSINRLCETETIVQFVLGERSRKIELVWITVIEFIKWYNENKN